MDREARIRRAIAVKALLDNEEIKAAWGEIEADLFTEWKNARTKDEREQIWQQLNNLERLQTWMQSAASQDLTAPRKGGF